MNMREIWQGTLKAQLVGKEKEVVVVGSQVGGPGNALRTSVVVAFSPALNRAQPVPVLGRRARVVGAVCRQAAERSPLWFPRHAQDSQLMALMVVYVRETVYASAIPHEGPIGEQAGNVCRVLHAPWPAAIHLYEFVERWQRRCAWNAHKCS